MVKSVEDYGTRSTGFIYQQKDNRGWFLEYPFSMPSHLMYGWAQKHHVIILRYNYYCTRMYDGVNCVLDNVKLFYPAGVFIPYRVFKHGEEWKLFDYHAGNGYGYEGIYGRGYYLFNRKGIPTFPKQLGVDTFPKEFKNQPEKDEDFQWKGLASSYIMG